MLLPVIIVLCAAVAVALMLHAAERHDKARRARYGRRLSPGCFRCHGCDSHLCKGTCSVATSDREGGEA